MGAVNVRVSHDDDAVVAQLVRIEVVRVAFAIACAHLANARTQCGDERENLVAGEQLFIACFFNI